MMCGILGTVNLPLNDEVLGSIAHRGPDDSGILSLSIGRCRVRLGHRRLSIVDLSPAGAQPMSSPDGLYHLVYNGEVYNHSELRSALGDLAFRGHSDTETILHHLASRWLHGLKDLNGIFAIALVDVQRARLLLARDPFGVKPLYYIMEGQGLAFSSEIRALRKLVPDDPDPEGIAEALRLRYSPSPHTMYRRTRKVPPGFAVEVDLSGEVPRILASGPTNGADGTFYSWPVPDRQPISAAGALARYSELFPQAVERQLMSDVEVGILLSGGVDSALVAQAASRRVPYRMKAFTVGFQGTEREDEVADAAETASVLGLEHHVVRIGWDDFLRDLRECVQIVEEPLGTTSLLPMHHLSRLAAQHVKVVLSGQGADEPLGGYGRYRGELLSRFVPRFLARLAQVPARILGVRHDQVLRGLKALGSDTSLERLVATYEVFTREEVTHLVGVTDGRVPGCLASAAHRLGLERRSEPVERMMSLDMRMDMADDLLLYTDKITMHHSLECRVPLLDHDLVRFVESLPVGHRVTLRRGKIIHRAYARTVLPGGLVERKKKGFLSPTGRWFGKRGPVRDILLASGTAFSRYFDLAEVERVLLEQERGWNRERHIFLLLSLHCLLEEAS